MGLVFASTQSDERLVNQNEAAVDNEYVLSDVSAFLLQGAVKRVEAYYYHIPMEEFEGTMLADDKLQPYLSYSREADFDQNGISDNVVINLYDAEELKMRIYRKGTPYHHNERTITSVMLYGDDVLDSSAYHRAVLNQEFTIAYQSWEKNRTITRINEMPESQRNLMVDPKQTIVIETYDDQQRLKTSERVDDETIENFGYLYLTFEEYQRLDLANIHETNIEVSATLKDLQDHTSEDFIALDPRVSFFILEEVDIAGNAGVSWRFDSTSATKRISKFVYY